MYIGPPQIQSVTVYRSISNGSPLLTVSWTTVSGSGITYTVRYSTSSGTTTEPPSGASTVSGITGSSTTLSGLISGTNYYIWVVAVDNNYYPIQRPYSKRYGIRTYSGNCLI